MALFDANTLMLLLDETLPSPIDRTTKKPVTEVEKRIKHLVGTLQESRKKIIIPTPALAEILTHAERSGADYFTKINRSSAFRIESFEVRAAIELARMTASAIQEGDKKVRSHCSMEQSKIRPTDCSDSKNLQGFDDLFG